MEEFLKKKSYSSYQLVYHEHIVQEKGEYSNIFNQQKD